MCAGWLCNFATAADLAGRYFLADPESASGTLDVALRRDPVCSLTWRSPAGRRSRGLGLRDGDDLLAASVNTGGAAYGLIVFHHDHGAWRGRWITSIDGAGTLGDMAIDGDALPGGHRFSGRGRAGGFEGSVNVAVRGPAFLLNFTSAGGIPLYRGIGVLSGDRLVVAWNFGGNPALALYTVGPKGLAGQRVTIPRRGDATVVPERLTRDGADETIFPPLLPSPAGGGNP